MTNKEIENELIDNLTPDEQNDLLNAIFGRGALEAYFEANHMHVPDKLHFERDKD